jgi:hypothetical protein
MTTLAGPVESGTHQALARYAHQGSPGWPDIRQPAYDGILLRHDYELDARRTDFENGQGESGRRLSSFRNQARDLAMLLAAVQRFLFSGSETTTNVPSDFSRADR